LTAFSRIWMDRAMIASPRIYPAAVSLSPHIETISNISSTSTNLTNIKAT
jgi:hypothetical protein